jgi:membrane-associated phospholipid phosphatase
MMGTTLGISVFFVLYFWVMHSKAGQAVTVPMTAVDGWIAISQYALLPYASLWLYVSLAPAFASDVASLRHYVAGALAIALLGLATYWLFPTATPAFAVDWSHYPALGMLKASDRGGNAFPSLHVAFAAYTAIVIERELRSLAAPPWARGINWLWCAAIVYSTLATRQHVVIDVIGGLLLTWLAVRICSSGTVRQLLRVPVAKQVATERDGRGRSTRSDELPEG